MLRQNVTALGEDFMLVPDETTSKTVLLLRLHDNYKHYKHTCKPSNATLLTHI